jgi:hypothetical protein
MQDEEPLAEKILFDPELAVRFDASGQCVLQAWFIAYSPGVLSIEQCVSLYSVQVAFRVG